jgi:hypothetical protein
VLELAREQGLTVEERPFTVEEAKAAREACLTSASNFIVPITNIDGKPVGDGKPGPMFKRLRTFSTWTTPAAPRSENRREGLNQPRRAATRCARRSAAGFPGIDKAGSRLRCPNPARRPSPDCHRPIRPLTRLSGIQARPQPAITMPFRPDRHAADVHAVVRRQALRNGAADQLTEERQLLIADMRKARLDPVCSAFPSASAR